MSNRNNDMTETGLAPDYGEPSAFAAPAVAPAPADMTVQLANSLATQIDRAAETVQELARRVACGVILTGWLLGKAKMAEPRAWGKRFGKGGFDFTQQRANQFVRCAAAVWERARAAGCEADFTAQADAALESYRQNPTALPVLPVLARLESTQWVSVHAMMIELGVIAPRRVLALPKPAQEQPAPVLPGLEELCAQCWTEASRMVGNMKLFVQEDAANLNKQQRATLRDELQALMDELDRLDNVAPALN